MNRVQKKIYSYFERNPQLYVLFIFDKMVIIKAELNESQLWTGEYIYKVFDGAWLNTKYVIENSWKNKRVVLLFGQESYPQTEEQQLKFPLLDMLKANMEYREENYASFMLQLGHTVDVVLIDTMQNYLANKSFNHDRETHEASTSISFGGNTKHTVSYMLKNTHLFESIPTSFIEGAFLNRIHLYSSRRETKIQQLTEKSVSLCMGQTGVNYEELFVPYLYNTSEISIEDPYIRAPWKMKNFMELVTMIIDTHPVVDLKIHLVTNEKGKKYNTYPIAASRQDMRKRKACTISFIKDR